MEKVINGKRYNTKSATLIAEASSDFATNDFKYWEEELYKKQTGEFFIYGKGGGMSKYKEKYGDVWGQGEEIVPLTLEEAEKWAEKHLDYDEYEIHFNIRDEEAQQVTYQIPISLHEKVKKEAEEKNITQKELVIQALTDYFNK